MDDGIASLTAQATSLMRALHCRADARQILNDPWGDRLVPEELTSVMRRRAGGQGAAESRLRSSQAYANVIVRSRYAEDLLFDAAARGVRQYVLIGAGFDSFILRRPESARHVTVIEVDHPATQRLKRERISACGIAIAENIHFLAADLSKESLADALVRSRFETREPAFFSWLGVTMYLSREANLATFRSISSIGAPGSEVVFNYVDQATFETLSPDGEKTPSTSDLRRAAAAAGEPFVSGFHPVELKQRLADSGLELIEDFSTAQLVDRYDPENLNKLRPNSSSHIAWARVP